MVSFMSISSINPNFTVDKDKKRSTGKYIATWFAIDMGVGTCADIYYSSKNNVKRSSKEIMKQTEKNALWAGVSALAFGPILGKLYNLIKQGKSITDEDVISTTGFTALSLAILFRLFVASRPHPKWKCAFSKLRNLFDIF